MANDLRNPSFRPQKQQADKKKSGCAAVPIVVFIAVINALASVADGGLSVFFTIVVLLLIVGALVGLVVAASKRNRGAAPARPQPRQKSRPAREDCPNPEPHRHFAAEPPRRYGERTYAAKPWPTPLERREENLRHLYDAGLLTREEYNDMLRRARSSL